MKKVSLNINAGQGTNLSDLRTGSWQRCGGNRSYKHRSAPCYTQLVGEVYDVHDDTYKNRALSIYVPTALDRLHGDHGKGDSIYIDRLDMNRCEVQLVKGDLFGRFEFKRCSHCKRSNKAHQKVSTVKHEYVGNVK